jgi:hypothetical protein
MHRIENNHQQATGTMIGGVVSMLLLVAFGLSSVVFYQKDTSHHATEQSNRPVAVSAYLA